jgi:hypothetical protein
MELCPNSRQEQWTFLFSEASGVAVKLTQASCEIGPRVLIMGLERPQL